MLQQFDVEVQADVKEALDHVCRAELWLQGRAEGSPAPRLASALAAYAGERRPEHGAAIVPLPHAARGIVLGVATANAELKLAVFDPVGEALRRDRGAARGATELNIHVTAQVDDIVCAIAADAQRIYVLTTLVF